MAKRDDVRDRGWVLRRLDRYGLPLVMVAVSGLSFAVGRSEMLSGE